MSLNAYVSSLDSYSFSYLRGRQHINKPSQKTNKETNQQCAINVL